MLTSQSQHNFTIDPLPSPPSDDPSDLDSIAGSIEKSEQNDQLVDAFRETKEQEFRLFEQTLRSRRRKNTDHAWRFTSCPRSGRQFVDMDRAGSCMTIRESRNSKPDASNYQGLTSKLGPSKPVVSVERVTINGMTTPPSSGTPPLARSLSRSPHHLPASPPIAHPRQGYFNLTHPASSLSLPQSPSADQDRSPSTPTSPDLPTNKRRSALRTSDGRARKRKHVTFRLADSVLVDPGSSDEHTSGPSLMPNDDAFDLLSTAPNFGDVAGFSTQQSPDAIESSFFSLDEELVESCSVLDEPSEVSCSLQVIQMTNFLKHC